ncbi:glycosyltransferase [Polluticoccus soli]|uniref:glycosyltransferase n=1 Tax=Polluticoccus soli TaxID=3034150 RepID=UPI0023E0EF18|nr:glycosyltransferase [Flavipsychrobacter sp. JY13-12]
MSTLAIVIPAFKETYFDKALNSLANQTLKNFTVYIGNDNSPYDLDSIVAKYVGRMDIVYKRFDNNIGSKDIVQQWERCIALTREEPWLWLFSDDDIADSNCVEAFFALLESGSPFDVCRFNTSVIDGQGKFAWATPVGPNYESSEEMAYHLLLSKRGNSMPDHIFSRSVYNSSGGFVHTPYAAGADWATSMLFSRNKGIYIIPGASISWRNSGLNITSASSAKKTMIEGYFVFLDWVLTHFGYLKSEQSKISYEDIRKASLISLSNIIQSLYNGIPPQSYRPLHAFFSKHYGFNKFQTGAYVFGVYTKLLQKKINKNFESAYGVAMRYGSKIKRSLVQS